jgi:hypothetical protein
MTVGSIAIEKNINPNCEKNRITAPIIIATNLINIVAILKYWISYSSSVILYPQ